MIALKGVETGKPIFKARFVAYGLRNAEKFKLVQDSTNGRMSSGIFIALAAIIGFGVWTEEFPKHISDQQFFYSVNFTLPQAGITRLLRYTYRNFFDR